MQNTIHDNDTNLLEIIAIKRQLSHHVAQLYVIGKAILCVILLGITLKYRHAFFNILSIPKQAINRVVDSFFTDNISNFHLEMSGNKSISRDHIFSIISNLNIQQINTETMRKMLHEIEKIPIVKSANISRNIATKTLHLNITEHKIIAIATNEIEGQDSSVSTVYKLLSESGKLIDYQQIKEQYNGLIIVHNALQIHNVNKVLQYLEKSNFYKEISQIRFLSNGRFDIILKNNLEIKLPRNDWQKSVEHFEKLDREFNLSNNKSYIKYIDMRIKGKVYIGE